jgi:hypothetical protein
MDHTGLAESDSPSDIDEQTKTWESDPRSVTAHLANNDDADHQPSQIECGVGHRVQASRSVLALVVDEDCVFAGLQGGDIVVCGWLTYLTLKIYAYNEKLIIGRRGLLKTTILSYPFVLIKKVSWTCTFRKAAISSFRVEAILLSMYGHLPTVLSM